ncbi:unnamed protein product [Brassica napus]|uniref:(rape) hypothetical protein n=1 Tax=Brassica napus TaxID=3708 RepID=A0A816SI14_BRANA|nr:unnamed protein product [Brassica napus]
MKNVAKCDTWCELQNPVNHRVFERKLRPKPSGRGHVCLGVTNRRPPSSRGCGMKLISVCYRTRLEKRPQRRTGPKFPGKGRQRVRAPSCPDPVAPRGAVYESGCLGMQPQSGGKFRPRLNMGERPIANKYRECLKLSGGKRMGASDASSPDAKRSNPHAPRRRASASACSGRRPVGSHSTRLETRTKESDMCASQRSGEASSATDRAQVPWKGAPERVRAPSCPDPVAPRGAVYESGCLGMQPQSGGKFRPRLNMGERPIANKYRESQRVLEIVGREADGGGDASWSDAERSNPVRRSIRGVDRRGLRW